MPCPIKDDDGDWSAPVMLIMRGNAAGKGTYEDENGNTPAWPKGALHEGPAIEYARLLVSVSKLLESTESVGFQRRWPDSRRGRRCGRLRTDRNTIVIICGTQAISRMTSGRMLH